MYSKFNPFMLLFTVQTHAREGIIVQVVSTELAPSGSLQVTIFENENPHKPVFFFELNQLTLANGHLPSIPNRFTLSDRFVWKLAH